MKEDLSRKEITRCIGNGFEVYMEYRVGLGWKNMEKWEKTTNSGHSRGPVPVLNRVVPVQFGFWSFLVYLYRYRSELYRYTLLYFD